MITLLVVACVFVVVWAAFQLHEIGIKINHMQIRLNAIYSAVYSNDETDSRISEIQATVHVLHHALPRDPLLTPEQSLQWERLERMVKK